VRAAPGLTVLWTAHRTRTATKTFGSLKGMTSRKRIAPFMLEPRNTNGEQEIRFKNGSVIMFGAREQGFGRGFDEVDIEVFDEAQILTEKALEDMVAATNQSRHEAGALLFFMGTPPRPGDPGEEFTNRRNEAISGKSEDMVYVEFSADPDATPTTGTRSRRRTRRIRCGRRARRSCGCGRTSRTSTRSCVRHGRLGPGGLSAINYDVWLTPGRPER
jgi:hypothetical protein